MPWSAPYSGPLTILIYSGATPYQGIALNKCASTQPEVPDSNWSVGRIVSNVSQPLAHVIVLTRLCSDLGASFPAWQHS
jgi:hypothetical protein